MSTEMAFLLYVGIFRTTVCVIGCVCIYFGFKLFVLGVMPREGSEIDAQGGNIRLTLKNAAPGTIFGLIGMLLVLAMLLQGMPTFKVAEDGLGASTTEFRGGGSEEEFVIERLMSEARRHEDAGSLDAAISTYAGLLSDGELELRDAIGPLMAIASIYNRQGRNDEAVALSRLISNFASDNIENLKLLASIEVARGNEDAAKEVLRAGAQLHPSLLIELGKISE